MLKDLNVYILYVIFCIIFYIFMSRTSVLKSRLYDYFSNIYSYITRHHVFIYLIYMVYTILRCPVIYNFISYHNYVYKLPIRNWSVERNICVLLHTAQLYTLFYIRWKYNIFTLHHAMIILMTCCDRSSVFTILLLKQTVHILKSKGKKKTSIAEPNTHWFI